MATTKILPVRKRLKDCLDYAANPKKTEIFRGDALDRLMHYTQNEDKTEHQLYVTGFNCDPQNACLIMEATKRRWHKDIGHGNVGYHIIQSFKPGEASPDQVHQIGCELARRCLADRFECTVSTHLDKGHLYYENQKTCICTGNSAQNQAQLPDGCYGCRRRNRDGFACVCGRPAGNHQCTE